MNARLEKIVRELARAAGQVLADNKVMPWEYREGIHYLVKTAEAREIALLVDVFVEHLVIKSMDSRTRNSTQAIEGPFFYEDVPWVTDHLKVLAEDKGESLIIRGRVASAEGGPLPDATVFIWHSTPFGEYTGFQRDVSPEYYRGKVKTDAQGQFEIRTTLPVPYMIPHGGPVGELLEMMGQHPWRPAHVHFKLRADRHLELTTQAYFHGGEWVDDDVAGGILPDLIYNLTDDNGAKVLSLDFVLETKAAVGQAA